MVNQAELTAAAHRLLDNDDLKLFVTTYLANLQQDVMDSSEQQEIMKLHTQHAAVRDFLEFIRMMGEKQLSR